MATAKTSLAAFFEKWDVDGSGGISPEEIRLGLKKMGMEVNNDYINKIMADCDADGNGIIDYDEFASAFGKGIGLANYDLEAHGMVEAFQYDNSKSMALMMTWGPRVLAALGLLTVGLLVYFVEAIQIADLWLPIGVMSVVVVLAFLITRTPGVRFVILLNKKGIGAYHQVVEHVFGKQTRYAEYRRFGWFGTRSFMLRDPAMIDRVLCNPHIYARSEVPAYRPFNVHSILGSGSGDSWLRYRVHFNDYFSKGYQEDLPAIKAIVTERMATWKERGEIDLMSELYRIMVEIRGQILFGTRFGCFTDESNNLADIVEELLSPPSFPFGGGGSATNQFHGRITEAIKHCTKEGSVGFICKTLAESGEMSDVESIQNASVYVLAHAPTSVIFWALYRAARDKRCAELRSNETLLLQSIKEELRQHPGVPTLFSRLTKADDINCGVRIPAGSAIMISPPYYHRNPNTWEDADTFNPERWEFETNNPQELHRPTTANGDMVGRPQGCPVQHDSDGKIAPRFIPFGGGQHKCQGRLLAVEELALVIRTVLEHVELEVIEDQGLLDRPLYEHTQLDVYNKPIHDVRLRVRSV